MEGQNENGRHVHTQSVAGAFVVSLDGPVLGVSEIAEDWLA